ncbi:TYROSINE KINASE FAMILY PROTEIN [Salix koriyanagi]|uniref:TYROSINE KINASE FAMILY PROTEIN n=1 Tax=Salix koriyanagi TaxID=2511006 RepID=A0A9Q0X389_9ROSI|nr:TYROSINE KINASE FAMILY PROTEIN [Salix koriyanagi]
MKRGGRVIYGGKLGVHSKIMIDYFQGIKGVPPCPDGYNPATWMLEVTTSTVEERVGEDFAELFRKSYHYREVEASIMHFGSPLAGSEPLKVMLYSNSCTDIRLGILEYWFKKGLHSGFVCGYGSTLFFMHSIPGWWLWFYYICPIAWTLRGIICSQLGDVETIIVGPGFEGTVKKYLEVTFGYGPDMIGASIAALVGFCLLFFIVFAFSVKFLNFQKR